MATTTGSGSGSGSHHSIGPAGAPIVPITDTQTEQQLEDAIQEARSAFKIKEDMLTINDDVEKMENALKTVHTKPVNNGRIDTSEAPHFNDHDWEDNFAELLYKSGVPVQVRELNEMQTIISDRIRNLADGIFVETGEILKAGQVTYSNNISYVSLNTEKLLNNYTTTYDGLDASLYIVGKYITDTSGKIQARVVAASSDSYQGTNAENHSLTLFLSYIYSDGNDSTIDNIFKSADALYLLETDGTVSTTQIGTVGKFRDFPLNAVGKASLAQIKEGVVYVNGVTLKVWPQTLIVDKYGTIPTYRIGLVVEERLITAAESPRLSDNSIGSPGEGGPGADRKQLVVRLAKRIITSENNERFVDLLKVVNGDIQWKNRYVQEDASKSDIIESEYDHRGDKIITPFDYEIREHLSTNTDSNGEAGIYSASAGGNTSYISLGVDNGTGTVQGREIDVDVKQRINIEKPRTVRTKSSSTSVAVQVGNYVVTDGGIDITEDDFMAYNSDYISWMFFNPNAVAEDTNITLINLRIVTGTAATIGTARVRDIIRFNDEFKIYLYDIKITDATRTLKDVEQLTSYTNDYKIADINTEFTQTVIQSYGASETAAFADDTQFGIDTTLSSLNQTSLNKSLFKLPKEAVHHESGVGSVVINSVRTAFFASPNGSSQLVISGLGTGETFDDTNLSSNRNVDVLVFGAGSANASKMWSSSELVITYNGAKTQMTITEDGSDAFQITDNYVIIAPVKLASPTLVAKTLKFHEKNVTTKITTRTVTLNYADTLDKNWKVYENGNGWGNNAETTDTDVTDRWELDTGQRDNSYEMATIKLKDEYPLPTGSLKIDYYYLQHGSDAQQDGAGVNFRVGDYSSVDSYPVGIAGSGTASNWGTFEYTDIPTYTSASTGEIFRLSDVVDFRPVKNSDGDIFKASRVPLNTTVDIGQIKYYQPRIDKIYLTNGSKDPEEIADGSMAVGEKYKIVSVGTSNFVSSGAGVNIPDEIFIATSIGGTGTGKVTRFVGNLRLIKGTPHDGAPVVPDDPKVGLPLFEVRMPPYTFSTKDIIVKQIDNVERKNIDIAKYEKIIENLQRQASVDPLEAKADSYDIGSGRKKVGHFFDSFEGHGKSDVLLPEYSAAIDRFRNELRPEYSASNIGIRKTPQDSQSLYDPQTNSISDKELLTLPLNAATNYEIEVQNIESSIDIPLRTTHTDIYNGYMRITPNYDYWKSTKSRPDIIRNKNGEFDVIKHHPTAADTNGMVWEDWRTHWSGFSKNEFEELSEDTSQKNILNELKKSYEVESNSLEVAGKHVLTDYTSYIRTQNIIIEAYGLRPNTSNIRLKFDGVDITTDVYTNTATSSSFKNTTTSTLRTDDYGRFVGTYTIPNVDSGVGTKKFKSGKKSVVLDSARNDVDCYAEAVFNSVGYIDNKVSTRNVEYSWEDQTDDTLSQSFEIFDDCFIKKIDLYFTAKEIYGSIRPVILQLRRMIGGKPSDEILPFSTVVVNTTDKLNFTSAPTNFSAGDTVRGQTSNGVGIIISKSTTADQVTIKTIAGKFDNSEVVTNGTTTYTLNASDAVITGIVVDGSTATTFEFTEFVHLPKGKYCITLITPSPMYKVRALDLRSEVGARMTGVGQLYQGYDILKGRLLKFKLWRAKFNTTLSEATRTGILQTSTLANISLGTNPLQTWDYTDTTNRNTIRVHQKNHGQVANDKITFGGAIGINTVEVDLTSVSSTSGWEIGEVIYQHSSDVSGDSMFNYPFGVLVEFTADGASAGTAKIAMLSTDGFTASNASNVTLRQAAAKYIVGSAARNALIDYTNFNTYNKYKKRLNGIDVALINNGAVTSLGSASGSADNNLVSGSSGATYSNGENINIATTAVTGSGTGLTVRFFATSGVIDNYTIATKTAGVHVVNPGTGYSVGDEIAITTGDGTARIIVTSVNANEYTVQSGNLTHDYYEVKRTGSGNVGSSGSPNITSFADNTTDGIRPMESSVLIKADTGNKGPRLKADLIYHSDSSIIPEDTTLNWSTSFNGSSGTYEPFTRNANEVLDVTKYISDNFFLKAVFDSSNDRVSPVVDKSMLNLTLVNNRMDSNTQIAGTFETSAYISRKTTLKESANSIKVVTDAIVPKNSDIELWCRVDNATSGNKFSDLSWTQIPQISVITTDDSDTPVELSFIKDDLSIFSIFQIKVVFKSSDTTKVPRLKNIMAIANYKDDLLKPMQALTLNVVRLSVANGVPEDHTVPTEFTVMQGNVFLIDYDGNSSYSSNGTVEFLRDADGSITPLNSTLNTGCTVRFTSTSGTNSFRAVVIIFGR